MTSVERLIARLRTMTEFPEEVEFQRTNAGQRQREAGAWSWLITSSPDGSLAGRDLFGSYSPVGDLLKAERLVLCPARRHACVDFEVYDAKDVDESLFIASTYIFEDVPR